jgi:hypothetical protein
MKLLFVLAAAVLLGAPAMAIECKMVSDVSVRVCQCAPTPPSDSK